MPSLEKPPRLLRAAHFQVPGPPGRLPGDPGRRLSVCVLQGFSRRPARLLILFTVLSADPKFTCGGAGGGVYPSFLVVHAFVEKTPVTLKHHRNII